MIKKLHEMALRSEYLAGGVLIAAALIKAAFPAQSAVLTNVYGVPAWANVALIQLEIALGILLISNVTKSLAAILGLATFLAFACFSAYRALAGFETCGCFGAVKVHPWFTFAIDLFVASALLWKLRRPVAARPSVQQSMTFAVTSYVLLGIAAAAMLWAFQPNKLADEEGITTKVGNLVILEPETWHGKKLPITDFLLPQVNLSTEKWTILLYHHDCPKCQAALPFYARLADQDPDRSHHVALVEVPPFGTTARPFGETVKHEAAMLLRLSNKVDWFVQAPVEIQVTDGIVVEASRELPSIEPLRKQVESLTTTHHHRPNASLE